MLRYPAMVERNMVIIDGEEGRLAATTSVLHRLFPDANIVESILWRNIRAEQYVQWMATVVKQWTIHNRVSLVVTNIDGVLDGLIPALLQEQNARIHCVLTTCYDEHDVINTLRGQAIELSALLGHIECPSIGHDAVEKQQGNHRKRLERYFSSLPEDHPFAIGSTLRQPQGDSVSRSTTYSTALPETYAASNR